MGAAGDVQGAQPSPTRWPRGTYNHQIVILGVNGCGKTTRARAVALNHARQGVRVFLHDPDGQFAGWPRYADPRAWHDAEQRAREAKEAFPLVARFPKLAPMAAMELGVGAARRAGFATPSLVCFDEGSVLYGKARREVFDERFLRLITGRRNLMTGTLILSQWVTMLHYLLLANATELHLMRLEDELQARYLERFLPNPTTLLDGSQVERDQLLAALPRLERGACYVVRRGF